MSSCLYTLHCGRPYDDSERRATAADGVEAEEGDGTGDKDGVGRVRDPVAVVDAEEE